MPPPPPKEKPPEGAAQTPAPAVITVSLPADARLTVDDRPTQSTSSHRVFVSPVLQPGKDYFYTLKAEVVRDGQTQSVDQRVIVRAGRESRVTLTIPTASVAAR